MKRITDRLIPAEALRFDKAHPMTRPWPALELWCRQANPAIGWLIPEHLWPMALIEFIDDGDVSPRLTEAEQ